MSRTQTDQVGVARYPSPRLWKDCRHGLLNDLGLGFYQHSEFNGGFQSTALTTLNGPTLPDPTDAPANDDALRDDLTAVWIPFLENVFTQAGGALSYTALTDSPASTAALVAELNARNDEIEAAFLVLGEVVAITDFAGANADAVREEFVATQNGEIEDGFASVFANDEYSMDDFEMDFDVNARLTAKAGELGGWIDVETGPNDNDAFAFFLRPFGEFQRLSQKKMWFEVSFEVGALADQGVFIGWAEEAALSRDIIADNTVTTIGESYVGFRMFSGDTDGLDAVYKLDNGTEVEVLADVTNGNGLPAGDRASVAANTPRKVGMRFDGRRNMEVFVDGYKVTSFELSDTTFPTNVNMGFIVSVKTGTAARQSIALDWARVAYEEVH
jgi:hypothetical protein